MSQLLPAAALCALLLAGCADAPGADASGADNATPTGGLSAEPVAAASPALEAGTYDIDPVHSEVGFRIKHLGISNVDGTFGDVSGTLTVPDGGDLAAMQTTATMQAASISTRNGDRDAHLRSADFFDADRFPTVSFRSTAVEPLGGGRFRMTGDLTMHGVTKPVTLDGEYSGAATDGYGNRKLGFSAEGTISRSEWGLTWNQAIEAGGVVVADDVRLVLDVQAARQAAEAPAAPTAAAAVPG